MSEYVIESGSWEEFRDGATAVRTAVFVEEQGVAKAKELDGKDPDAIQFLARDRASPIGTARLRLRAPAIGKVERVAVREPYRGSGVGSELMRAVEDTARKEGATELTVHAQSDVEGFYERLGYETVSDVFQEAGIPHVEMRKTVEK